MYSKQFALLGAVAAVARIAAASPHPLVEATTNALFKRATVSPDNTCGFALAGAGNNYTCGDTNLGACCSQSGYCGATDDYCGTGCQLDFGTCNPESNTDPYVCGPTNSNKSCSGGQCCSLNGYCGNTTDYCAAENCNSSFGVCNGGADPGADQTCGPNFENKVCANGACCSPSGYCGTTKDYCQSPDCLLGFGKCDADTVPAGASTANDPRPALGDVPYGADIYDCASTGSVALTYDDGPYLYTNDMLDLLAQYGFKATFFVTGINLGKGAIDDESTAWPALLRRMIADGHQVASHSWSHADLSTLNETQRENEMVRNEMAIRNVIGKYPTYMRPPYSSCNAACLATMDRLGYHVTYFDLDTQDYLHTTPDTNQISKDVVHGYLSDTAKSASNTDYLSIAHDIHDQTVHNLTAYMFEEMVKYGWKGVTAGACLNDPEENWYRSSG
ncbi:hypothetical protein EDC01DRAFT_616605 [Geopyxis carbonaria]|nr:hypothetical protein EDC01DRAFT_616605 [Geopyxis carbonaria]